MLKSIGFTPAQVTATYLAQISIPAVAGAVAGTILGNSWVLPVIGLYEVQGAHVSVPLWINLTAPLGMLALAGLAAAVPGGAGRAAARGRGDHRRAGAPGRARRGGVPAGRAAGAAGDGDDRAGRPVLPPGPVRGHAGRPAVRAHRGRAGHQPERLHPQDQPQRDPRTGAAADRLPRQTVHASPPARPPPSGPRYAPSREHCTTSPRPTCNTSARPGGHRSSRDIHGERRRGRAAGPAADDLRLRRRLVVAGLEPDQRALVQRPRPGRCQHRLRRPTPAGRRATASR